MLVHPALLWLIHTDFLATMGDGNVTKMSPYNQSVPISESQQHVINPTHPRGALHDSVEHRLHVGRRTADDPKHLGRRGLMLQRLAQFRIAFLDLFEQAHVCDGDHGLVGKSFKEGNLFVGEWIDCGTTNENCSNCKIFTHQWHSKLASTSLNVNDGVDLRKLSRRYGHQILNMDWLALDNGPACY